ncbi:MAG: acyl-CoA dehydrogenase domain protein [Frankiales bacterium]|nr:acyl-CoA dehydrogenase domain protein [Frankiales bacterium]
MTGLTPDQDEIDSLASRVLAAGSEGAEASWESLAGSGLLGLSLPEAAGGSDRGLADFCLVMLHAGRHLATEPLWPTVCALGLPWSHFGGKAGNELLNGIATGQVRSGAALLEGPTGRWGAPTVTVAPADGGWRVDGTKTYAEVPERATHLVVSAVGSSGDVCLVLLDPTDPALTYESVDMSDGRRAATVRLDAARAMLPPLSGEGLLDWVTTRITLAICAYHAGVARSAVELTAAHLREREQFGRPLGAFQAVAMRAADAYMDADAMWATTWAAAQAVDAGEPSGAVDVAVANAFGRAAGARVLAAAQHLHGGVGVDITYPLHRYFLASKRAQLSFGSAAAHLDTLGAALCTSGTLSSDRSRS